MHVVHVERQRSLTGQTRRVQLVARALHARGSRVTVIAHPGAVWTRACRDDGVPVIELPLRGPSLYASVLRAARLLRGQGVDLLHCHGARDQRFGHMLARLLGVRCVLRTKHNHTAPHGPRSVRFYQRCERIVTVSEHVRRVLVDAGVDPERVEAIPTVVDPEVFVPRPRDPELMRSLGLDPDDVVIGNLSSLHARKGIDDVLRAYVRLRKGPHGARLKCLLAGKQREPWAELARRLGVSDGVVLPGFRDDVPAILSLFDVYVLMSREEALGTSVLEAMAMERPVVVSDVGGLVESVAPETGIRVPRGDVGAVVTAVEGLLGDRERARRMGIAGRERVVRSFSPDALLARTFALYERVLAASGGRVPGGPGLTDGLASTTHERS